MTKLRKSEFDSVSPSHVLKSDEHFCLIPQTRDPQDHADYKAAMKIASALSLKHGNTRMKSTNGTALSLVSRLESTFDWAFEPRPVGAT
jgi:hypothetical protein